MLLNFGNGNIEEECKMGDAVLVSHTRKGFRFCADMKVSEQCGIVASKKNQII